MLQPTRADSFWCISFFGTGTPENLISSDLFNILGCFVVWEVISAQSKIRETQKENDELMRQLAKKERECEAKTEEKDELMQV